MFIFKQLLDIMQINKRFMDKKTVMFIFLQKLNMNINSYKKMYTLLVYVHFIRIIGHIVVVV
jgi:hypothetical protein